MDIETITTIMDDVLKGVLDLKEYPYSAKQRFGVGNKVATGSLRASIMVVAKGGTQIKNISRRQFLQGQTGVKSEPISFQIFANDYFQWVQSGRAPGKKGVPIDAILDWMSARGIFATDVSNVKYRALQSQVSTAYIINKARIKKGKHPLPMKVLIDWIKNNPNFVPFNIDLQKGMAFAIQKNIIKFGILPANIEDKFYNKLEANPVFMDALEQYTFEQFVDMVDNIFISTKIETI
jgi:hypothetical protein